MILKVATPTLLRFVWNFFRLENEHLNNCGQFRVVRDISIAPVDMKVVIYHWFTKKKHQLSDATDLMKNGTI